MTQLHVVVGAGPVGSTAATRLAEQGHRVRVVTRSGSGPVRPGVECMAADAADAPAMARLSEGASAIYNCANPSYTTWTTAWPPLSASLLSAAEASGAVLAAVSNLYVYGPVDRPMTEQTPMCSRDSKGRVRTQMWRDALAAHQAGRVRYVEVRASDYPDAPGATSHLSRHVAALRAGRTCQVMGSPDRAHSWTATGDVVALLLAAAADPTAYGRAWHVPSAPPRTQREALTDLAAAAGLTAAPKVRGTSPALLRAVGLVVPVVREIAGTVYQFADDFVIDDSAAREHFGLTHTPWPDTVRRVLANDDAVPAARRAA
ncbi:NAD-dependent epimerase/dehydratase family protein [Friedmanniella luteola]|nr:NAD-dependent epimerase/dehydratase family protein [Friedmanniella luteola]